MENPYHLFLFTNVLANLLIRLAHLVAALHALNDIDVVLTPQGKGILRLALGANGPGNKTFTH
jgi:hypothetical protein